MRLPVILGALAALALSALALAAVFAALDARSPVIPPAPQTTVEPGEFGLYTPPPTATPRTIASPSPAATPVAPGSPAIEVGTHVGQRAPRLRLPHLTGGFIDTAELEGRPLWIYFMATWCPDCRHELPMMQLFQLNLDEQVAIIVVDVKEDADDVLGFMIELGVDLPVALDEDGAAQQEWGAFALPVHFFIDEAGVVQEVVFGGAPREIYVDALRKVAPEAEIEEEALVE